MDGWIVNIVGDIRVGQPGIACVRKGKKKQFFLIGCRQSFTTDTDGTIFPNLYKPQKAGITKFPLSSCVIGYRIYTF